MKVFFEKYHGTGNDFIVIDDRKAELNLFQEQVEQICNRRFGIGADGLLLLRNKEGFDFEMVYYNSDGKLASMCGNGSRCIMAFAHQLGIVNNEANFLAADGKHEAFIDAGFPASIRIKMKDVDVIEETPDFIFLDTGSPHCVVLSVDTDNLDVVGEGRKIRNNTRFKKNGTNVNFIEIDNSELYVRSYERGVEDETLSCGTGVVASALAIAYTGKMKATGGKISIRTRGGKLSVYFEQSGKGFKDIWLEGPATAVFSGSINI